LTVRSGIVALQWRFHIKQENDGRCLEMLKAIAAGVAIAVGFGGAVMAQPARTPLPADPVGVVLVKHDKEDNGRGRKLVITNSEATKMTTGIRIGARRRARAPTTITRRITMGRAMAVPTLPPNYAPYYRGY
jgi:hypothetical protein